MHFQFNPYAIPALIAALVSIGLIVMSWRRRPAPGSVAFASLLLGLSIWSASYAIELCGADLQTKLLMANFKSIGILIVPTAWFVFALQYSGFGKLITLNFLLALAVVPVLSILAIWTNRFYHLNWTHAYLDPGLPYPVLTMDYGWGFWANTIYSYLLNLVGTSLILRASFGSPRQFFGQKITLLVGILAPWIANIIHLFKLGPYPSIDLTPFAFTITGFAVSWSLFGFRLFELIPVARAAILDSMDDGTIVLDSQDRVVDLNLAATKILGKSHLELTGKPFAQAIPTWADLFLSFQQSIAVHTELHLGAESRLRHYDLSISPLFNRTGHLGGRLLVLRDITTRITAEQELLERAHNLTRLNELTHLALEPLDFKTTLQKMATQMGNLLKADDCFITLMDTATQHVIPTAAYGEFSQTYPTSGVESSKQTMTASVLAAGHTLVAVDTMNSPYIDPEIATQFADRSLLGLPLSAGSQKLGAALIGFRQEHTFTTNEIILAEQAAGQIALAISKARAFDEAQRRAQEAETLRNATAALASTLDLHEVLDRILSQLDEVLDFDSATVFLLDKDRLRAVVARGLPDEVLVVGLDFPADDALLLATLVHRAPLFIADVQADPRFNFWGGANYIRGWMGVPLLGDGDNIGYMTLDSRKVGAFGPEQAALVQAFANQAAVAIEKARLYQETKEAAERRAVLHRVSQEIIAASLNPEQIYAAIHQAVAQIMPCEAFSITVIADTGTEIDAVYLIDKDGRHPSTRVQFNEGFSGHVISSGKTLYLSDLHQNRAIPVKHFGGKDHVRSILAVPLQLGGKAFGMIATQSYQINAFSAEDIYLLEMLAAHAAIALDNARLFSEVQKLAITDELTGLYNLRGLFELGRREIDRTRRFDRPLSCIFFDLDHFKEINDTYSHAIGNQLLTGIADRCRKSTRDIDLLARYGGEEFVILLPETDLPAAQQVAERLRTQIAQEPFDTAKGPLPITISLGIAHTCLSTPDLASLINHADLAMYDAKQTGRNRVALYTPPLL